MPETLKYRSCKDKRIIMMHANADGLFKYWREDIADIDNFYQA